MYTRTVVIIYLEEQQPGFIARRKWIHNSSEVFNVTALFAFL